MNATDEIELERVRIDSLIKNIVTGLGVSGIDKRLASQIATPLQLTKDQIDALFEGNIYAKKLVSDMPKMATRKWAIYSETDGEPETVAAFQKQIDKVAPIFRKALKTSEQYGGSAILVGCDDGELDYSKPVNLKRLKKISWLNVLEGGYDSSDVTIAQYQQDPSKPNYGKPEIFQLAETGVLVHCSRILMFTSGEISDRRSRDYYNGWGVSVLSNAYDAISDYSQSLGTIANAIHDFNRTILQLEGLQDLVAAGKRSIIEERIRLLNYTSSIMSAMLLGTGDKFLQEGRNFAGLKDVLEMLKNDLGAHSQTPHTQFFNQSPDGVTSGTSEKNDLNSSVADYQETNVRDNLERLINYWHHCKEGIYKGKPPENWEIKFPVIHELSELEKSELRLKEAQANKIYLESATISPDEMAEALSSGVPVESVIDMESREMKLEEVEEDTEIEEPEEDDTEEENPTE